MLIDDAGERLQHGIDDAPAADHRQALRARPQTCVLSAREDDPAAVSLDHVLSCRSASVGATAAHSS